MSTAASAAAEREETGLHRLSCRETTFGERSFGKFPGGLEAETFTLPMQGSRVRSPVREVTSHMLRGTPFYKNKEFTNLFKKREISLGTLEKAPAKDISSFKLEGVVRNGFLQWQLPRSWFIWVSITQLCPTFFDPTDCGPPGSSVHGDYPGNNTGMGCHFFLQGIFPTQGSNPGLPPCRQPLNHLSHQPYGGTKM